MKDFTLHRGVLLLIITLASFLILTACTPTEPEMVVVTEVVHLGDEQIIITRLVELVPTATPTAPPPAKEPEPVTLDIAYESALPNLDPQHVSEKASLDLAESMFAGLTNFNHETNQVEPELAASWVIGTDGRTWTFNLRDDMYWVKPLSTIGDQDSKSGQEIYRAVDAHDVVYAFQRACTAENGVTDAFLLFNIEGCEALYSTIDPSESELSQLGVTAVDEHTVQITLTEPSADFLTITTLAQFRPVPRELVEEFGDEWRNAIDEISNGWQAPKNLVVSGPFVPSADPFSDEELILNRNASWPLPMKGNVDIINIQLELDEMEMFELWQKRQLDISILPAEERDSVLESSPEKVHLITNQTVFYLGYNFDSPVFQEAEVRRAFSAAIDRDSLIDSMFDGRAQGLRHFAPPGVFGAPPEDQVGVGYSPDFALLQMDKSSVRSCKLIPPITMLVSTADLSLLQAELIRDIWIDELDCDEQLIQVEQVEFGELLANTMQNTESSRPDFWELAWPGYYPDAQNFLTDLLHCTQGENRQNRQCSEVDRLMLQAKNTFDPQERIDLYRQIENSFFSESGSFPLIPLYVRGDYSLIQVWLSFPPALSGGEQFDTYLIDQELKRLERSRRS
ncbi:MAG: ABC transporter substrate-binding protein [Candidatus Promineifilaceae bacterium]